MPGRSTSLAARGSGKRRHRAAELADREAVGFQADSIDHGVGPAPVGAVPDYLGDFVGAVAEALDVDCLYAATAGFVAAHPGEATPPS